MNDLISVIIPVYKVEPYLDACVQSVVDQTHRNLEIILVDDGSPDRCGQMCDDWAAKDSRIRVIHKENGGVSDARNVGLDSARGNFIAFVDSDDRIEPSMYTVMLETLLCEDADICACNILACYPDYQVICGCREYTVGNSETFLAMLYDDAAYPVSAWNKIYRRECWENIRFPLGVTCGEDAIVAIRLADRANRIVQRSDPFYLYLIHNNSAMTSPFTPKRMDEEEAWRCNYRFIAQHYPKLKKNAFDFYLQRVNVLIHTMSAEDTVNFASQYQMLRKILKSHFFYILLGSRLGWKQRIRLCLDIIRI